MFSRNRARIEAILAKREVADGISWLAMATEEIVYRVWTLSVCRIGHKPVLNQNTSNRRVLAKVTCTRCKKDLDIQVSILMNDRINISMNDRPPTA